MLRQAITTQGSPKYAVLIDGDNSPGRHVKLVLDEIVKMGINPSIRRVYGDFSNEASSLNWKGVCQKHGITAVHTFVFETSKGTTDAAMMIDAMDLLHTNDTLDGFVLFTNDSDFCCLVQRIHEAGKSVVGVGNDRQYNVLKQSCDHFLNIDNLIPKKPLPEPKAETIPESEAQTQTETTLMSESQTQPQLAPNQGEDGSASVEKAPEKDARNEEANSNGSFLTGIRQMFQLSFLNWTPKAEETETNPMQVSPDVNPLKLSPEDILFLHESIREILTFDEDHPLAAEGWVEFGMLANYVRSTRNSFKQHLHAKGFRSYRILFEHHPHEFETMNKKAKIWYVRSIRKAYRKTSP